MAVEEIKVSNMDLLETIPGDAIIYVVVPGDTTPYKTTKDLFLAGISGGSQNLQQVNTEGAETTIPMLVKNEDNSRAIEYRSDGFAILADAGNNGMLLEAETPTGTNGTGRAILKDVGDDVKVIAYIDDIPVINENYKGTYTTLSALNTAHPTSTAGSYAIVDGGVGVEPIQYLWDANDNEWVAGSSFSATTTDALPEGVSNLYFTNARAVSALESELEAKSDKPIQETILTSGATALDFTFDSFNKITQTGNIVIDGINTSGTKKINKSFLIQGSTNPAHTITFPNNWMNLSGISADSTKINFIEIELINGSVVYSLNKYDIPDTTAPTLLKSSILLDALNTIELLYSEAIDSSVTTQTSWFNVAGKTVSSVTILTNRVRIVVSVPFNETDTPLVTFTNQVAGAGIQDASGNKATDFSQNIGVTTYRFDNFNRANSTTSINSPSDGGSDWVTPFGAVWGINSNKGYCFGANTTTATAHAIFLETNESNVVLRKKVTYGTTGVSSSAFLIRYTDNNNHYIVQFGKTTASGGQLFYSISKFVAGVGTTIVANTNYQAWVSGTEYTFMVKCSGNVITLYNGTTILTQITDNSLPTGTKHGLRIFAGSGSTGNNDRYDDFGVYYG